MASRRLVAFLLAGACTVAWACGDGDDDPELADARGTSSTSSAPDDGAGEADGAASAEVAAAATAPPLPQAPGATGDSATPGRPADHDPFTPHRPAPGRYTYTGHVNDDEAAENTLEVEQLTGARQRHRTSEGGQGQVQELDWTEGGVLLLRQHNFRGAEESGRCSWSPAVPQLLFPLHEERSWEFSSTCRTETPTSPSIQQKGTVKVLGTRSVTVGGQQLTAVAVERSTTTTTSGLPVVTTSRRTSTELWALRHGLVAEVRGTSSTEAADQRRSSSFDFKLTRVTPS